MHRGNVVSTLLPCCPKLEPASPRHQDKIVIDYILYLLKVTCFIINDFTNDAVANMEQNTQWWIVC